MRFLILLAFFLSSFFPTDTFSQDEEEESSVSKTLRTVIIPKVSFDDIKFSEALEILKEEAKAQGHNLEFEFSPSVTSLKSTRITLKLSNVPISEALRYSASLSQTKFVISGDVVKIMPVD